MLTLEVYCSENVKINIDSPSIIEEYINFLLKIKVGCFYGEHNFCIQLGELREIIEQLNILYEQMTGEIKLFDYDSETYISLEIINNSRLCLCGQLGSEWEDNFWRFHEEVDQTIIKLLIDTFNKMISQQ